MNASLQIILEVVFNIVGVAFSPTVVTKTVFAENGSPPVHTGQSILILVAEIFK